MKPSDETYTQPTLDHHTCVLHLLDRTGDYRICPEDEREIEEAMHEESTTEIARLANEGFAIVGFAPVSHDRTRTDIGAYRFVFSRHLRSTS